MRELTLSGTDQNVYRVLHNLQPIRTLPRQLTHDLSPTPPRMAHWAQYAQREEILRRWTRESADLVPALFERANPEPIFLFDEPEFRAFGRRPPTSRRAGPCCRPFAARNLAPFRDLAFRPCHPIIVHGLG